MTLETVYDICAQAGRRPVMISSGESGVVAVCGMEGRLFFGHRGRLVSLFRPEAAVNYSSSRNGYFNPGGDGLWPAPEGTALGYEYATGDWRVPTGLCNAHYEVIEQDTAHVTIEAEVDLVNNRQLGIPVRFSRDITVREQDGQTIIDQQETIEYIGTRTLTADECLLAPWSLCQFTVTPASMAVCKDFPGAIRDLYAPSGEKLSRCNGCVNLHPDSQNRLQLALPETAEFVELLIPEEDLRIRRTAMPLSEGLVGTDIADAAVDTMPGAPVRYSIYNDPSGFMELEIAGGCHFPLNCGTRLPMVCRTVISSLDTPCP